MAQKVEALRSFSKIPSISAQAPLGRSLGVLGWAELPAVLCGSFRHRLSLSLGPVAPAGWVSRAGLGRGAREGPEARVHLLVGDRVGSGVVPGPRPVKAPSRAHVAVRKGSRVPGAAAAAPVSALGIYPGWIYLSCVSVSQLARGFRG